MRLRVNSFIATLGMSQLLAGIVLKISGNRQITEALSDGYRNVGRDSLGALLHVTPPGWLRYPFDLPMYVWYLALLAVAAWYVLEHTPSAGTCSPPAAAVRRRVSPASPPIC